MYAITAAIAVAALLAAVALYAHYRTERCAVRQFARTHSGGLHQCSAFDIVLRLASHIHFHVPRQHDDPLFLSRVFEPLGASPGSVITIGGCCSGVARLLIVALNDVGIPAAQLTLNHRHLHYRHCVVEARLDSKRAVIIDPKYGMYYTDAAGALIALEDLRAGVEPQFVPLPGLKDASYPSHEIYDWNFQHTGTANWVKSGARKLAYRILNPLTRGRIDLWRQPVYLEWPQLVLCAACLALSVIAVLLS